MRFKGDMNQIFVIAVIYVFKTIVFRGGIMIERSKIEMLSDFMAGCNTMIDASSQMVSCHRLNPKWIAIRDMLMIIRDGAKDLVKDGLS